MILNLTHSCFILVANMWAKQKQQSGFTIVELLIVIVVIGILAAITIVAFNGVQQRGRDTKRTTDISSVKQVLEMYKADNGTYPAVCSADNSGCNLSLLASALVPTYTNSIPQDVNSPTRVYHYVKGAGPDSYGIYIQGYESITPCKTGVNVAVGWWGTVVPTC